MLRNANSCASLLLDDVKYFLSHRFCNMAITASIFWLLVPYEVFMSSKKIMIPVMIRHLQGGIRANTLYFVTHEGSIDLKCIVSLCEMFKSQIFFLMISTGNELIQ